MKRHLKTSLRLLAFAPVALIILPLQWVSFKRGWLLAQTLPVLFHRLTCRFMRVQVKERGNKPAPGAALILANHVAWLDIPVIGSLTSVSFIAKSEVEHWPLFGALAHLQNSIFIDRSRKRATADTNPRLAERLRQDARIVLFAEGTTGDGTNISVFRSSLVGAIRHALDAHGGSGTINLYPLALVYADHDGKRLTTEERARIAWVDDVGFGAHFWESWGRNRLDVFAIWGEPIPLDASTCRKQATLQAEEQVREAVNSILFQEQAH